MRVCKADTPSGESIEVGCRYIRFATWVQWHVVEVIHNDEQNIWASSLLCTRRSSLDDEKCDDDRVDESRKHFFVSVKALRTRDIVQDRRRAVRRRGADERSNAHRCLGACALLGQDPGHGSTQVPTSQISWHELKAHR